MITILQMGKKGILYNGEAGFMKRIILIKKKKIKTEPEMLIKTFKIKEMENISGGEV